MTPSPILPHFHLPSNAFSMGRSKHHSNEAHGPTVTVKSSNSASREPLCAQSQKCHNLFSPWKQKWRWMGICLAKSL